jgi:hypothetical protein
MKMYLVRKYRTRIEEIEVTRFNATSYWTAGKRGEQRSSRFTSWESAFPTWIDAKEFIVQRLIPSPIYETQKGDTQVQE